MTNRLVAFLLVLLAAGPALAQEPAAADADARPAFSLSTSEVFTTRDAPHFYLTHRRIPSLDVRVYRVKDPFAFFSGLKDPHQLGNSGEVYVPQERSAIERLADWKRQRRSWVRDFFRRQISHEYRAARTAARDQAETRQRVQLNVNTFAQVPLLNPEQLVTSWRELLPNVRDAEMRRVPLEVRQPGAYLVEAVHDLLRAYTVVMVTDVGLVTKTAPGQVLMFAADRFTGEPVPNCEMRVLTAQQPAGDGRTGDDGLFEAKLPDEKVEPVLGIARCDDQVTATDPGSWSLQSPTKEMVGFIYSDKPIYRPGQTVHVKAVLRWRERDALRMFDRPEVELVASDANDKAVFRRQLKVDPFGTINTTFTVPLTGALGTYALTVNSADLQATSAFEVQEYRKPEFEVMVTPASRFVVQGRDAVVTVQARYYFGQPVANGLVRWVVNQQAYYSPLRWDDSFDGEESSYFYGDDQTQEGTLRLDASGRAEIRVPMAESENQRDFSARIEAQVTDASNREVAGRTVVHATWGPFLVSAQTAGSVFRAGNRVETSIRAVDYVGAAQANVKVALELERLTYPGGRYNEPTATQMGGAEAITDARGLAAASVTLPNGQTGSFKITVTALAEGREIKDETWVWVPGEVSTEVDEFDRYLELLADKKNYQPGDVARLVVRGETVSGPILVTKEGQHVSWYRVLRPGPSDPIEVPIEAGDVGDVYVSIAYLREGRLNRAERRLSVPAADRTLQITLTADQAVSRPRDPGTFSVQVADHQGRPVRAQVSLAVIDEAVYGVRPDDTPDPVRFFYRREYTRVNTTFSREYYFTGFSGRDRLQLTTRKRRPMTLADFKGDKPPQPEVRKDFPDAIFWIADLVTDAQGAAKVAVRYPDALTTWRLTARAVTEDTRAGASIARTTTTKDLIVRIVTPRFLTEGDEVVLPTIVHNYRDEPRTASVSVTVAGLDAAPGAGQGPGGLAASLAAGAERRDDWRFAARVPGDARVTAAAKTESDADAVELPIPVLPYGLRREATASGSIVGAGEAAAEVTIPEASNSAARSIRIALAPSMAGSLLGALDFLTTYPYGCVEQTLSSFLPNLLVTRALTDLKIAPTERLSALDRMVSSGLLRLLDLQHEDGGWGWWKSDANHPFMTAYALWGLDEARRAGVKVDQYRVENGVRALARMYQQYPRAEPDLKVYMAFALQRAAADRQQITWFAAGERGQLDVQAMRNDVWEARPRMTAYGRALLLLLLDDAGDGRGNELAAALEGEATSTGELSHWTSDTDPLLFESVSTSVEATAFAVQALARRGSKNPVVERAARWLLLNRTGGYWGTTKQTAMAVYGLLGFMQARGDSAQPFSVDVHVNGVLTGTQTFSAAAMTAPDPLIVTAPGKAGANQVRLVKRDGGTVYWSAAAQYYDTAGAGERSGSRRLAVTRRYSLLTPVKVKDRIVYRETPLTGAARPGDVLTIRLTMAGAPDWRYVMLEDPLPGGVEAIQDTTAYPLENKAADSWWWGSNVEYRDQRTVFFQEEFTEGRYEYVYLVKVTSAGTFRAVPAQVSPMYVPGVFASSEPQTLTVAAPAGGRQ